MAKVKKIMNSSSLWPRMGSVSKADREAFKEILKSDDANLLDTVEGEVVLYVNWYRSPLRTKPYGGPTAGTLEALDNIQRLSSKLRSEIKSLDEETRRMLEFKSVQLYEPWWSKLLDLEQAAPLTKEDIRNIYIKKGPRPIAELEALACALADILWWKGYKLKKYENSVLGRCLRKAMNIAASSDIDENVKCYVESAIAYLIEHGKDPLNPPKQY